MDYNILINLSLFNYYNYYLSSKLCHVNSIKGQNTLKICMILKTRVKETSTTKNILALLLHSSKKAHKLFYLNTTGQYV